MKLYSMDYREGYESFYLKEDISEISEQYSGIQPIEKEWGTREVYLSEKLRESDISCFYSFPINMLVSEKGKKLLKEFLEQEDIELLPVYYKDRKFYIVHVIKAYEIKYEIVNTPEEWKEIIREDKVEYSEKDLMKNQIDKKGIFRIYTKSGNISSQILVTDRLVETIKKYDLKGIDFRLEWNSEKNWTEMSAEEISETERGIFSKDSEKIETDFGKNLKLNLELQGIDMNSEMGLVQAISKISYVFCNKVIEHYGRSINKIRVCYFYDGESLDLFVNVNLYNKETDVVAQAEYLITYKEKRLGDKINQYIFSVPRINQGDKLEELAEKVVENLKRNRKWLRELNPTEEIEVEVIESD